MNNLQLVIVERCWNGDGIKSDYKQGQFMQFFSGQTEKNCGAFILNSFHRAPIDYF